MTLDVIAQFELRIVLEGRVRQIERCEHQALPVARQKVDTTLEVIYQPVKLYLALEGLKKTDVKRAVRRLVV
jgi:hypothetical protein